MYNIILNVLRNNVVVTRLLPVFALNLSRKQVFAIFVKEVPFYVGDIVYLFKCFVLMFTCLCFELYLSISRWFNLI